MQVHLCCERPIPDPPTLSFLALSLLNISISCLKSIPNFLHVYEMACIIHLRLDLQKCITDL